MAGPTPADHPPPRAMPTGWRPPAALARPNSRLGRPIAPSRRARGPWIGLACHEGAENGRFPALRRQKGRAVRTTRPNAKPCPAVPRPALPCLVDDPAAPRDGQRNRIIGRRFAGNPFFSAPDAANSGGRSLPAVSTGPLGGKRHGAPRRFMIRACPASIPAPSASRPASTTPRLGRLPATRRCARDGYRCVICGADISGRGQARVDHIEPVRTHPHQALSLDNLRSLCPTHDNQGHREKGRRSAALGREERFVIAGPAMRTACRSIGPPLTPVTSCARATPPRISRYHMQTDEPLTGGTPRYFFPSPGGVSHQSLEGIEDYLGYDAHR
jgi:hypothetical protein